MAKKKPSTVASARQVSGEVSVSATASLVWQGPIPPAHEMEHYERVMPGSANRILAMAESQIGHRQQLETTVVKGNIESERRGQRYGLAVVAAGRLDMNQEGARSDQSRGFSCGPQTRLRDDGAIGTENHQTGQPLMLMDLGESRGLQRIRTDPLPQPCYSSAASAQ